MTGERSGSGAEDLREVARPAQLTGSLLRHQILRYVPGVLIPAAAALIGTAVFTRLFTSAEYGRYSIAMSIATAFVLLGSQWLQQGIMRFLPRSSGLTSTAVRAAVALGLLVTVTTVLVVLIPAAFIARQFVSPEWDRLVPAVIGYIVASVYFASLGALLQAEMRASQYTAYAVVASIVRLTLSLVLVLAVFRDVTSMIAAQAVATGTLVPFLWREGRLPRVKRILRRWRAHLPLVRRIGAYGFPMAGWSVAAMIVELSDRWIIQLFRGSGEVGVYAANYSLVLGAVGLVAVPMTIATHPFLMRAWGAGDRIHAARWLSTIVEWYLIVGTLVVAFVALYARDLAALLLGPEFRIGYPIIPVVLAGMLVWQLGMYSHKPLEFTERTGAMFGLSAAAATLNVILNLGLVPRFGYTAAAYTTLASYLFYTAATTRLGWRILPLRLNWRRVLESGLITALGVAIATAARLIFTATTGLVIAGVMASALVTVGTAATVLTRELRPTLRRARQDPSFALPPV